MSNIVLQQYRQQAANQGYNVDSLSDDELLKYLGDDLRQKGMTMSQMEKSYGKDFTDQYFGIINAPEPGREGILGGVKEFGAGFKRGAAGLMSSGAAMGSMAADFFGYEDAGDALMDKAAEFRAKAAQGGPSIERATDVRWDNINDVARYLSGGLGEATPSVLEAGGSFLVGGGGGALIAKQAAKKKLRETFKNIDMGDAEKVLQEAVLLNASKQGKKIGSNITLAGSSFGMNQGEIYSELYQYSKLDPSDPDYISEREAKRLSITYGGLAGSLDFASAGALLNRVLNIGEEPARRYIMRLIQNLPSGVLVEGGTEAAQQFLALAAEKYGKGQDDVLSADEINQLIDAGFLGALGGAQFTAISSIPGPSTPDDDTPPAPPTEDVSQSEVKTIDERASNLRKLLQDPDVTDYVPEIGEEVQSGLGIQGKVTEIRGDGLVGVELLDGNIINIGLDTLAPKLRTAEELQQAILENNEGALNGDLQSQLEIANAQKELNEKEDNDPNNIVEADEEQMNKPDNMVRFELSFGDGSFGKDSASVQIEESKHAELKEVIDEVVRIAKEGDVEWWQFNNANELAKNSKIENFTDKYKRNKKYLEELGILEQYMLSGRASQLIGLGKTAQGKTHTKKSKQKEREALQKAAEKRQSIIKSDANKRGTKLAGIKPGGIRPGDKVRLQLNFSNEQTNVIKEDKDGKQYIEKVESSMDNQEFEVDEIVEPYVGDGEAKTTSNMLKLKGLEGLIDPRHVRIASGGRKRGGKSSKQTSETPPPPNKPLQNIPKLAIEVFNGDTTSLQKEQEAFIANLMGEQGKTVTDKNKPLGEQLGFQFDEQNQIKTDDEGNAIKKEVDAKALADFFAVNQSLLQNNGEAIILALQHKEQNSEPDTPPQPDVPPEALTDAETVILNLSATDMNPLGASKRLRERVAEYLETDSATEEQVQQVVNDLQKQKEAFDAYVPPAVTERRTISSQIPVPPNEQPDILNAIQDNIGKIKTQERDKSIKESEAIRTIRDALSVGPARLLRGGTKGQPVDTALDTLKDIGEMSEDEIKAGDAVEILAEKIADAIVTREKLNQRQQEVDAFNKYFDALTTAQGRSPNQNATRPIQASTLVQGDMFKVKGKWVKVVDVTPEGFLLEHEEFGTDGSGDVNEPVYPVYLMPSEVFYADLDLVYARDFEYDPFSLAESEQEEAENYIAEQRRANKAMRTSFVTKYFEGDIILGYESSKVMVTQENGLQQQEGWMVPDFANRKYPNKLMPISLSGDVVLDDSLDDDINADGTYVAESFEGLKKSGKKRQGKENPSRVLLILEKVDMDASADQLPLNSIRVMQAQEGQAKNKSGKQDVVIKVYDSLRKGAFVPVKRDESFRSDKGRVQDRTMAGYRVIGKVTTSPTNSIQDFFSALEKKRRGQGGNIDQYFADRTEMQKAPFMMTATAEEAARRNPSYAKLDGVRKIMKFVGMHELAVRDAYTQRLDDLNVKNTFETDSKGRVKFAENDFRYVRTLQDVEELVATGVDRLIAEDIYNANFGEGDVTLNSLPTMEAIHLAQEQMELAYAGRFKYNGKQFSVIKVILAATSVTEQDKRLQGYKSPEGSDIVERGSEIYNKALEHLEKVANVSYTGVTDFVDMPGTPAGPEGEISGKVGIKKAFNSYTQLEEYFNHLIKIDSRTNPTKWIVEEFQKLAHYIEGGVSDADQALDFGVDEAEVPAARTKALDALIQKLYYNAAYVGHKTQEQARETKSGSFNVIRPQQSTIYTPKKAKQYRGGGKEQVVSEKTKKVEVPLSDSEKKTMAFRQDEYDNIIAKIDEGVFEQKVLDNFKENLESYFQLKKGKIKYKKRIIEKTEKVYKTKSLGRRVLVNTKEAVEQAEKKIAESGYDSLTKEEKDFFVATKKVHKNLNPSDLALVREKILQFTSDIVRVAEKGDGYAETQRGVGGHRNIVRNRLNPRGALVKRVDKQGRVDRRLKPGQANLQTGTEKGEVKEVEAGGETFQFADKDKERSYDYSTINETSGANLTERLHDDFGKDIEDAMLAVGFDKETVDLFLRKAEHADFQDAPIPPQSIDDEIYRNADGTQRVKADGKTPFFSGTGPFGVNATGFSQTRNGKDLRTYVDMMWEAIGKKYISDDDQAKYNAFVEYINQIWIPEQYKFVDYRTEKRREKMVVTPQEMEDNERSKSFKDNQLSEKRDDLLQAIADTEATLEEGVTAENAARAKTLESGYQDALVSYKEQLDQVETELEAVRNSGVGILEKDAPKPATYQEVQEVRENGLLLQEYAQQIREYFNDNDPGLPFLETSAYDFGKIEAEQGFAQNQGRFGTDVLEGLVEGETDATELDEGTTPEQQAQKELQQQQLSREAFRGDEADGTASDYDDFGLLDNRTLVKNLFSSVTGEINEVLPQIVDEKTAKQADKIARKKLANASRDGKNPMEALGLTEELEQNRMAIKEFLQSRYEQDIPFPAVSFVERVLEIMSQNPNFRESEALGDIARRVKASKLIEGVEIQFLSWDKYSKIASISEDGYSSATYIPTKGIIYVSDVFGDLTGTPMENLVASIIHEVIHVPTKAALDVGYAYYSNNEYAKQSIAGEDLSNKLGEQLGVVYGQLNDVLLPMLREKGSVDYFYGLSSPDEFLSEVGSNAGFREFLRGIKLTNEDRKRLGIEKKSFIETAFDWVVNFLAQLLGIGREQNPELLRHTERQLKKVISLADGLSVMGQVINNINVRGIQQLDIFGSIKAQNYSQKSENYETFSWMDGSTRFHISDRFTDVKVLGSKLGMGDDEGIVTPEFEKVSTVLGRPTDTFTLSIKEGAVLSDILQHPELFQAYPQLKDLPVKAEEMEDKVGGRFYSLERGIAINPNYGSPSTLLHEIQHAVDFIEGLEPGASVFSAANLLNKIVSNALDEPLDAELFADPTDEFNRAYIEKYTKAASKKLINLAEQVEKMSGANLRQAPQTPKFIELNTFFQVSRMLRTFAEVIDGAKLPKTGPGVGNVAYLEKGGKSLAELLYYYNFGEVTARAVQGFATGEYSTGNLEDLMVVQNVDSLTPGFLSVDGENFNKEVFEKFLSKSWGLPSKKMLKDFRDAVAQSQPLNAELFRVLSKLTEYINQTPYPEAAAPAPRPDDGARIYHEASAGGLNELIGALTIAYREVQPLLGPDVTLEDFLAKYGKMEGKYSRRKIQGAVEIHQKLLKPFDIDSTQVRITDFGRNRVARNYGILNAIGSLEKSRAYLRKLISNNVVNLEASNKKIDDAAKLFHRLKENKLSSNEELMNALESKIKNNMSVQRLEEYVKLLPESEITQEDLSALQSISQDDIMEAIEELTSIDGMESMKPTELNQTILRMGFKRFSGFPSQDEQGNSIYSSGTQAGVARIALIRAIKDSKDILFLFRLGRSKLGEDQVKFLNAAVEIAKAKSTKELDEIKGKFPDRVNTLFKDLIQKRRDVIEQKVFVVEKENEQKVLKKTEEVLQYRSDKFRYTLGELENFDIRHLSNIKIAFEKEKGSGNWEIGEYTVRFKNGELDDRKKFISVNAETLRFLREQKGTYEQEPWFDLMKEQAEMALTLPVTEQWSAVRRAAWAAGLESVNQRFSRLGYQGKRLAGMTAQTVAIYRDKVSKAMFHAKNFNRAYYNALDALDIDGQEFYTGMYQDIFWWYDNHPEFTSPTEAFSQMWKHIREQGNVPNKAKLNEKSRKAIKSLVEMTIAARDYEAQVNRDLGNRVRDEKIKVQSYLDGEKSVDFYRLPLDMGHSTLPRAVNDSKVVSVVNYMEDTERGIYKWSGSLGANDMPVMHYEKDGEARGIIPFSEQANLEGLQTEISRMFDAEIVDRFLNPFMGSLNRRSLFYGPKDKDGFGAELGNSYVLRKWEASDGDIISFMDSIYDELLGDPEDLRRARWYADFFKQIHNRYRELKRTYNEIKTRTDSETRETEALKHVPRSLDARQIESRLPKDFFLYDMYDETSTSIRMAMFAGASVFGRDGKKATEAYRAGRSKLEDSFEEFKAIIGEVTGNKPDKPSGSYSKKIKRLAYKRLEKRGKSNPAEEFSRLHNEAVAYGEMRTVFQHLRKYYGSNNEAGPYKDARFLLELLGTQSLAVLNNPKSSFWQAMSMFEFPLAFRGANKMAAKGTGKALANFVNQTFGGIAEAMGVQLERAGRHAENFNNTHFKLAEMELSKRDYITQVGVGAEMTDKQNPKRYLRMLKAISMHHKARGTRAPVDLMSLVTGIFPYINNVVNHSVAVGAMHVYEDLVLKVAKHISDNGLSIDNFEEVTADQLGLGKAVGEWIIGEKDGFENANNMLVEAGAPSITRMAYDYLDRKKGNPNAEVITYDQGLNINQVAMNNMSGEGFNSKPAWLYTNPALKYFAFFLGWPLGKVARDNRFIMRGDRDSINTYMALLKYLGLVSAIYMPVGLSFAFLVDWYDEEVLEKPNNLPPVTPWAALPVLGPFIAASDPNFTVYSLTSRMAKAGTPYGMGFDLMNSIMAKGDPYSAAREFSLDSRIFAFSMFKNMYDAMGNWMHQGEFDWANVGRPMMYAMGGNSVIQMMDATNAMFDLDNEESRVANYIGMRNYIKSTAYLMGFELRPPTKGYGRPSPVSVNVKQMERAAYAGDEAEFLKQYQEAVEAAREMLKDQGRTDSPEKYVADRFRARSLRTGVKREKFNDQDWNALLEILPDDVRSRVLLFEQNHRYFSDMISARARKYSPPSQRELRAMMLEAGF